jgi:lycopene beta-cyclase
MEGSSEKYDYIIAGSGCAGLSLLYRILNNETLKKKKILVLDKKLKNENDRTWCFWEQGTGLFESIVYHYWDTLEFKSVDFHNRFDLNRYRYKMIRGIDFYSFVLDYANNFTNVEFRQEGVQSIFSEGALSFVKTEENTFHADYVFNSTPLLNPKMDTSNSLLQHFMGWVIETESPVFDETVGTLMDFTVSQSHGTTFMYVLPTNKSRALVEYTFFTPEVLEKEEYIKGLKAYISTSLQINEYIIEEREFGVIPMSKAKFTSSPAPGIINLGTAGGQTKASTGYTFQFVQKRTERIVRELASGARVKGRISFKDKVFTWYDQTMLEVLLSGQMEGRDIFDAMFKKVNPERILAFLGNESTWIDELLIMQSVPTLPFMKSGIKELVS